MIKKLRLHNFRTYLNAEFDFGRRHLIIGKNNSGKSSLCAALRFLGATSGIPLNQAANLWILGGITEMKNWAFKSERIDFSVQCELKFQNEALAYTYELSLDVASGTGQTAAPTPELRVASERLLCSGGPLEKASLIDNNGRDAKLLDEEPAGTQNQPHMGETPAPHDATMLSKLYELETNRRAIHFRRFLDRWGYFTFSPRQMRIGWREAAKTALLWPHGDNLATAIFYLKNQNERRYRRLIERVNKVEPDLEAINFIPTTDQGAVPFISLRGRDQASWEGLSDGTLRVLALAYLIEEAGRLTTDLGWPAPLFIIEEPENGIYCGLLRELLDDCETSAPEAQFLFTSHSPYFIDLFDRDLQNVTRLKKAGNVTEVKPLSDCRKEIERYRNDFSLGELHYKEVFE